MTSWREHRARRQMNMMWVRVNRGGEPPKHTGTAATSVERCAVTATRRPAGTAASATQKARSFQVGGADVTSSATEAVSGDRHSSTPQAMSSTKSKQKPADQNHA